jgi:hypothetical protein
VRAGLLIKKLEVAQLTFTHSFLHPRCDTKQNGQQADTRRFERKPQQKINPGTQIRAVIAENPRRSQLLQMGKRVDEWMGNRGYYYGE